MMKHCCDLHTHSNYSDGTWTPTQLIDGAEKIGLGAIALTDHNTVSGLTEFFHAAQGKNVQAIGGVELSTDFEDVELHIVGLFIQEEHFAKIDGLVEELKKTPVPEGVVYQPSVEALLVTDNVGVLVDAHNLTVVLIRS